ncbi:INO80 complex subunit B isoform X2 [Pleurodeles waltl]|uniref:INO80 complex subunit B isoform X2 n=1 Tax=Pleurodeles waltl TaxID=8319 RepID=UPI003709B6AE
MCPPGLTSVCKDFCCWCVRTLGAHPAEVCTAVAGPPVLSSGCTSCCRADHDEQELGPQSRERGAGFGVPTFTVIPEVKQSPSPLMVVDDDDEPMEGVPIEQYRAWLDEDSNLDPLPLSDMVSEGFVKREEDEEERWLEALEKGELDDNGELKKEVDESLLTARQKALLQKQQSLPPPVPEAPVVFKPMEMTQEMLVKREERARKRRLQAAKKAEENKNQTIERLTKTNKAKVKTMRERRSRQALCPMIRFSNTVEQIAVSFPLGVPCPVPSAPLSAPPAPVLCGVSGCTSAKKYSCSKTGVPLCSLECYRKNLQLQPCG